MIDLIDERLRSNKQLDYKITYNGDTGVYEVFFIDEYGKQCENFLQYAPVENTIYLWVEFRKEYTKLHEGNLGMIIELFFNNQMIKDGK